MFPKMKTVMLLLVGIAILGLAVNSVSGFTASCLSGDCGSGDDCTYWSTQSGCASHVTSGGWWHWYDYDNPCEGIYEGDQWYVHV